MLSLFGLHLLGVSIRYCYLSNPPKLHELDMLAMDLRKVTCPVLADLGCALSCQLLGWLVPADAGASALDRVHPACLS